MLQHDPLAYRPLLLRLSQSGTSVLPMGALRLLAAYARCAACPVELVVSSALAFRPSSWGACCVQPVLAAVEA